MSLNRKQLEGGRLFLHEHPAGASSWGLEEVRGLEKEMGVTVVTADQCMYGLTTWGRKRGTRAPARKRTKFMTNAEYIAHELNRRCDGSHEHQPLLGGRAKEAARYPEGLQSNLSRTGQRA